MENMKRNDNIITQDDNKITRYELNVGLWRLISRPGEEIRLITDSIMDELLGVDTTVSQEEKAKLIWENMVPEELPRFQQYMKNLLTIGSDEIVYQWVHPENGVRYIRCSGKCEMHDGDSFILNGYHQDITELLIRKEENRSAARLLENDYLRISYIDLTNDKVFTLKCVEKEREVQDTFTHSIEELIEGGYVAQEHQQDVKKNLSIERISERLDQEDKKIRMVYRRKVEGTFQWVESVIIPMEDYSSENARVLWLVKSLDNQKSGAVIIGNEQELIQAHKSIAFQDMVIQALSSIYDSNYYVDLENQNYMELKSTKFAYGISGKSGGSVETLTRYLQNAVSEDYREQMTEFVDLSTLDERMQDQKILSHDYLNRAGVWIRASIIPVKRNEEGKLTRILFMGHQIDHEKQKELEYQDRLLKAYTEANMANQAKSDFLARMSHDIRTPINGIMGMLDISERYPNDVEKLKVNREKARKAARYLLSLVNDVLDMSKLESGEVELAEESFDLNELLAECREMIEPMAEERHVTLITKNQQPLEHPNVIGSPVHVKQILTNITSNAVKYNRENGTVWAAAKEMNRTENEIRFRIIIEDNGIGMSEEFQKKLFDPFTREEEQYHSEYQGTGLGMSIVKKIVEKMNGSIEVQSKKMEGTRFVVKLPFKPDPNADLPKQPAEQEHGDITGAKILLAEDNDLNLEIATFFLEEAGAVVIPVKNGAEAVAQFREDSNGFDIILMDVMMPVMDGYEATRRIRDMRSEKADSIPIIAMTANAFAEDRAKSRAAGMNDHIAKPLDQKKVWAIVAKYYRRE